MQKSLLVLFLSFTISSVFAQTDPIAVSKKNGWGIKGGVMFSNLAFSEAPHKIICRCENYVPYQEKDWKYFTDDYQTSLTGDIRTGFHLGAFWDHPINAKTFLSLELNYEQKGIHLNYSATNVTQSTYGRFTSIINEDNLFYRSIRNNYVSLPILLKRAYGRRQRWYSTVGVQPGILVSSRVAVISNQYYKRTDRVEGKPDQVVEDSYSSFTVAGKDTKMIYTSRIDVGLTAGLGRSFPLSQNLYFLVDTRFYFGLLKVDRKYNNEYDKQQKLGDQGFIPTIKSTNYWHGLNSQARNINLNFSIGFYRSI